MTQDRFQAIFWPLAFIIVASIVTWWKAPSDLALFDKSRIIGPDAHYWLVVLTEFITTGEWHNTVIERSNAPYGESWFRTHPFLMALYAIYFPASFWFSTADSINLAGMLIAPVLLVLLPVAAMWSAAPLLGRARFWCMPILYFLPSVFSQGLVGRADHHLFLLLIFALAFGCVLRALSGREAYQENILRWAFAGGMMHALAIWVSIEALLFLLIAFTGLGVKWLTAAVSGRSPLQMARVNQAFCAGLACVLLAGAIAETPPASILALPVDRISGAHVLMAVLALLVWSGYIALIRRRTGAGSAGKDLVLLIGLTGLAGAIMFVAVPDFFRGPLSTVEHPDIKQFIHERTTEMKPVMDYVWKRQVSAMAGPLLAFPALMILFAVRRKIAADTLAWSYVAFNLAIFSALTLFYKVRFGTYPAYISVIPLAWLIGAMFTTAQSRFGILAGGLTVTLPALTVIFWPLYFILLSPLSNDRQPLSEWCQRGMLTQALNKQPAGKTVLASIFAGPQILYETSHSVIGTPYHRNQAGILDSYTIMRASPPEQAKSIIDRRGIDYIALCHLAPSAAAYRSGSGGASFYDLLKSGAELPWLEAVELPTDVAGQYRIYRVRRPNN